MSITQHNCFIFTQKYLGQLEIPRIPMLPNGIPKITLSVDVGTDGNIEVSAVDTGTQRESRITLEYSGNFSVDFI